MAEENNVLVLRLKELLNAGFHGGAWHGSSVLEAVKDISPKEASFKSADIHTVAELIYHITSWRIFTIKKLQGSEDYNIDTEYKNFGANPVVDEIELETLLMELSLSNDELSKELESKDDDFLNEVVPGSEYDYYTLINGIIHHDIYHTGQIKLLKKLCAAAGSASEDEYSSGRYFEDGLGDTF